MRRASKRAWGAVPVAAVILPVAIAAVPGGSPGARAEPPPPVPATFSGDPATAVAFAPTPDGKGLWIVASDGTVTATGDASGAAPPPGPLPGPAAGLAADRSGHGYWVAGTDGAVSAAGDAPPLGSVTVRLAAPIVGMATTPTGRGYWLVASDGGVFSFGDAVFAGSTGALRLNAPIVGMATTPTGRGYWLVASDGGVFSFGDAVYAGSAGGQPSYGPATGVAPTADGRGYWILAADGSVSAFGDATPGLGAGPRPRAAYPLASRMLDVTDPSRPTPPRGTVPGHPGRDLPTLVLSPAGLDGAPLPGPWPLVVFAHGFATTPIDYLPLLQAWATDGYAVAAPYLPGERPDVPGPPDEDDRAQEPADLSAVISGVLAASATPSSPFAGLVDPSRIAVAGHSDGAMAVAALTLDSADHDPRVRAAMILSGAEMGVPGGVYGAKANVPVLIAQGTADPINNPSAADELFGAARAPKVLLWILNAAHLPPYVTAGVQQDLVRAATADFLDATLWPSRAALARLAHDGDTPGLTSLVADL